VDGLQGPAHSPGAPPPPRLHMFAHRGGNNIISSSIASTSGGISRRHSAVDVEAASSRSRSRGNISRASTGPPFLASLPPGGASLPPGVASLPPGGASLPPGGAVGPIKETANTSNGTHSDSSLTCDTFGTLLCCPGVALLAHSHMSYF
jgi:hypothetical protein